MGKSELEVSEVGFGVWTLASGRWGSFTDDQAVDLLQKAYEAGINYYDVSPTDGAGRGEQLLGQAFRDKRELVIISSKAGRSEAGPDFSPASIRKSLDGTMGRLGAHAGGGPESDARAVSFPADGDLQTKDAAWIDRARKQATNLRWIYEGKGMTLSQAALKFILSEETVASAIPNIYREEQLAEYSAVSDFETFSQVELGEIAEQFRKGFGV